MILYGIVFPNRLSLKNSFFTSSCPSTAFKPLITSVFSTEVKIIALFCGKSSQSLKK
jgi:hypothetical protein